MKNMEDDDMLCPMPSAVNAELIEQILRDKKGEPNKYASYWEMDEEDVDEATEEEIQNNPPIRLLWAAENGKLDVAKEVLGASPELVTTSDKDGYTPLHRAAYNDHVEMAEYLLKQGADIESVTSDKWTPLHSASNWGNAKMAAMLLSHGADINAQTAGGQTALHLAASNSESLDTLQLLLMNPLTDFSLTNAVGEMAKTLAERVCKYHHLFEIADPAVNQLT